MSDGFDFHVDKDRIRVRFVSRRVLGRLSSGHSVGGDYGERTIRLPRFERRLSLRGALMHELGHYLVEREELRRGPGKPLVDGTTEEDVCDLFVWLSSILNDGRNDALREFLGLEATE